MNNENSTYLVALLGVAVVMVVCFFAWISFTGYKTVPTQEVATSTSATSGQNSTYASNIKVTFTNTPYPTDVNQPNARLRRYLGKVQNAGSETVTSLTIRVQYLDRSGKSIKEGLVYINDQLKPNFVEEFYFGGLEIPADWAGQVTYSIEGIHFLNEKVQERYYVAPEFRSQLDRPLPQVILPF